MNTDYRWGKPVCTNVLYTNRWLLEEALHSALGAKLAHKILGKMLQVKKILFVCSQNKLRSPTAEAVFNEHPRVEAMSAGTNHDAETPLSGDLIEWADVIVVMEKTHKNKVSKKFKALLVGKRIVNLAIPDEYDFMDPDLIVILQRRVPRMVQI